MQKITKAVVDSISSSEKDAFIWDRETKGFGLKITPKGKKVYVVQYRLPGSPTKRFTIGRHGSPWTPATARTEALRIIGEVAAGVDPSVERKKLRRDISLSKLCELYLAKGARTKKANTRSTEKRLIQAHITPLLGRKQVNRLTKSDIEQFMLDVAAGKTAADRRTGSQGRSIIRGGESVANRSLGLLGPLFNFAIDEGLRSNNPARGVKKFREGRSARFLSNDEIARLGDALRLAESSSLNPYALSAIRLLLLTGCRKNEILSLQWNFIDFNNRMLQLPDTKTGAKTVQLGAPALAVLLKTPRLEGNPFVIVGDREGSHLVNLQKVWAKVRFLADLQDVRIHDLRHSFASVAARSGESLLVIGKVLGHATTAATSRYTHLSDDPVKAASEKTSESIGNILDGKKNKTLR